MRADKDVEVKARVEKSVKDELQRIADGKRENISIVLREAINEYLERHLSPKKKKR